MSMSYRQTVMYALCFLVAGFTAASAYNDYNTFQYNRTVLSKITPATEDELAVKEYLQQCYITPFHNINACVSDVRSMQNTPYGDAVSEVLEQLSKN